MRTMMKIAAVMVMTAAGAFAADTDAFKGLKGTLDIAGGTAHIPVMQEAAKRIQAVNKAIRITVAGGGSGVGVQKAGEGLVQIGNTGRALKKEEADKYGLVSYAFAIDGVAAVVNPRNSVSKLSKAQLKDIFAGKITNWNEVGGRNAAITLYIREDGSGTRETFETLAVDNAPPAAASNIVPSNGAMKTAVAGNADAIGYVGIGHLDASVKGITLDGMVPSQQNAADGTYKITRLLYMNTKTDAAPLTKAFIDYIYSGEGARIVSAAGYIPVPRSVK